MSDPTNKDDSKPDQSTEVTEGYTRPDDEEIDNGEDGPLGPFCLCQQGERGEMIACNNKPNCQGGWFHFDCVGLMWEDWMEDAKWYCPNCRKRLIGVVVDTKGFVRDAEQDPSSEAENAGGGDTSSTDLAGSRPGKIPETVLEEYADPDEPRYCLCGDVSWGTMIACDNEPNCTEWFHLRCVGLEELPPETTKWYCPDCRI